MINKEARIVKRKGKWCVIGHKKDKSGKYRNFGCFPDKGSAKARLGQIYMFKHKKASMINVMTNASDKLQDKGAYHIADAIIKCAEEVITETLNENTAIALMKIVNILEKKGEFDLAEQLDSIIPEILDKNNDNI